MKLILGSQSSGRRHILEKAGYAFDVMVADIDEKTIRSDNYEELPLLLARAKAKALLVKINEPAILITSDQVVVCNGELREKPASKQQAREYLESYSEHPAHIIVAVVVTNTATGKQAEAIDRAKVTFKKIPSDVIDQLIEEGKIMHAAGGFLVAHPLFKPYIKKIEGAVDSIIGLPLQLTEELIEEVKR